MYKYKFVILSYYHIHIPVKKRYFAYKQKNNYMVYDITYKFFLSHMIIYNNIIQNIQLIYIRILRVLSFQCKTFSIDLHAYFMFRKIEQL